MKNSKILSKIDVLIIIDLVLIALSLCWINYGNFDVWLQNHFFVDGAWVVSKDEPIKKFIFYKFPKILFGVAVVGCLVGAILGFRDSGSIPKSNFLTRHRHRLFLIFLGLSITPLIAGNIKKFTNVYCPTQLEIYGGTKPYVKIFESYPADFYQEKKGKCFPAGHSVTGFALMILFFALEKKSQRILGLAISFTLGWIIGFYQIAKGVHFFGDTLVSMLVCFLLAAAITRIYLKFQKYD